MYNLSMSGDKTSLMQGVFHRVALAIKRGKTLVRMLCVVSLALASILHVVTDFQAVNQPRGQTVVSNPQDDQGPEAPKLAEACHSCSIVSFVEVSAAAYVAAVTASEVPAGRLMRVSVYSQRLIAPPPKA